MCILYIYDRKKNIQKLWFPLKTISQEKPMDETSTCNVGSQRSKSCR